MADDREEQLKPIKWYRNLATRKGRQEARVFLIEGIRAVRQVAESSPESIVEIVSTGQPPDELRRFPHRLVTERQMTSISTAKTPQGIFSVVRLPSGMCSESLPADPGGRILLLEDIQDPGNTGTLIRTAAAFGFSGIIMTEKTADPVAPKCAQSTTGTLFSLWIRRTSDHLRMAADLKTEGYLLMATDLDGEDGGTVLAGKPKMVIALGNEAAGLSNELLEMADQRIRIPIAREKAESLNVAACGAIIMFLASRES